jgi:hypothetical protein
MSIINLHTTIAKKKMGKDNTVQTNRCKRKFELHKFTTLDPELTIVPCKMQPTRETIRTVIFFSFFYMIFVYM